MKEVVATHLSLEDVMQLLEVESVPGKPWQVERFRKWIKRLVKSRGKAYVLKNRQNLLSEWERYTNATFKSCC
jgi:hypothetical protein